MRGYGTYMAANEGGIRLVSFTSRSPGQKPGGQRCGVTIYTAVKRLAVARDAPFAMKEEAACRAT